MEHQYNVNNFFEVEKIIAKKKLKGKTYYLIKWENYSVNESTWEPTSNLKTIKYMIKDFENEYPKSIDKDLLEIFKNKDIPTKLVKSFKSNLLKKKKFRYETNTKTGNKDIFKKNKNDELDLLKEHLYIKTNEKNRKNLENEDLVKHSRILIIDLSEIESLAITNESQKESESGDNVIFKNFNETEQINIKKEGQLVFPKVMI